MKKTNIYKKLLPFFIITYCNCIISSEDTPECSLEHKAGVWFTCIQSSKLSDSSQAKYVAELHTRFRDGMRFYHQNILRFGIGYPWKECSLWLGYDFIPSSNDKKQTFELENRLWQQICCQVKTKKGNQLGLRTRLEERFRENKHGTALRLRQKWSIRAIKVFDKVNVHISDELFLNLKRPPDWAQKTTVNQNRLRVGLELLVKNHWTLYIGYLNRLIPTKEKKYMDHILEIALKHYSVYLALETKTNKLFIFLKNPLHLYIKV